MSEYYLGEIRMFAGDYAPAGWALCDGRSLSVSGNEALFSLIGVTYGGDGINTFKLPDLRGRIPIHRGKNSNSTTTYALGQNGGTETVILTEAQMPAHTHVVNSFKEGGNTSSPNNALWAETSTYSNYAESSQQQPVSMNDKAILKTGGSQEHNNMMPSFGVSFIIALHGLYPTQQ